MGTPVDVLAARDLADPIDAARYLQDPLVVSLVAHHTCARVEADLRGLGEQLEHFLRPPRAYEDALCFCDITTGPTGHRVSAYERLAEIEHRYGPEHVRHPVRQ